MYEVLYTDTRKVSIFMNLYGPFEAIPINYFLFNIESRALAGGAEGIMPFEPFKPIFV